MTEWSAPNAAPPRPPSHRSQFTGLPRWQRNTAYLGIVMFATLSGSSLALSLAGTDDGRARSVAVSTMPPTSAEQVPTTATSATAAMATVPTSIVPTSTAVPVTSTAVPVTATAPTATAPTSTVPPPTTSPPSTTVTGTLGALDVLASFAAENEHQAGYDRELFSYGIDADGDGCDTRAEVLIRDSLTQAQVDRSGCAVVAGGWHSAYDDATWSDATLVEIDHVVSLKEAWDSGAWAWEDARRTAFGNDLEDPRSLRVVTTSENAAKSDKDPSNWIPPSPTSVCGYLADWVAIKARWGLTMDQSELGRIRNLLTDRCPGQTIAAWPDTPAAPLPATPPPPTPPPTPAAVTPPLPVVALPIGDCDPSYPGVCILPAPPDLDCGDIRDRRFAVLAPDPHGFDADDDGVGCER